MAGELLPSVFRSAGTCHNTEAPPRPSSIGREKCEALVSSINHSPLKRHEGRIILDKSSEKLPFEEQALNSTQLATALLYLLWGEFHSLLPDIEQGESTRKGHGVYSST